MTREPCPLCGEFVEVDMGEYHSCGDGLEIVESYDLAIYDNGTGSLRCYERDEDGWLECVSREFLNKKQVSLLQLALRSHGAAMEHYINQMERWVSSERL
jgi:hypothetical protein